MIVDTSAIISILFDEDEAEHFNEAIARAPRCQLSTVNYLETVMVLEGRRGLLAGHQLDAYLEEASIALAPVTIEQAHIARAAWRRFGRGNHPAGLNFGDCFAYALAATTREPLLFKGRDFALTDVESA